MIYDIVTRLRNKYAGQLPICIEAADEIERLRKERKEWFVLAQELVHKIMLVDIEDGYGEVIDEYMRTRGRLEDPRVVTDGYSEVEKCDKPDCMLQVVRPGKFQCECDE